MKQWGVLVKRFPVKQNKTKKFFPCSLWASVPHSPLPPLDSFQTLTQHPSRLPSSSLRVILSLCSLPPLPCLLRCLFNWCDISRSSDVAVARCLCASFQTAHVSTFPLPHAGFKCVCAFSFHPSLCFITTSTNSATEAREEAEWGASGMIRGERRQSRRVGLDGWRLYKAGSEDWNVCGGCSSNIELRLFLDTAGAT